MCVIRSTLRNFRQGSGSGPDGSGLLTTMQPSGGNRLSPTFGVSSAPAPSRGRPEGRRTDSRLTSFHTSRQISARSPESGNPTMNPNRPTYTESCGIVNHRTCGTEREISPQVGTASTTMRARSVITARVSGLNSRNRLYRFDEILGGDAPSIRDMGVVA